MSYIHNSISKSIGISNVLASEVKNVIMSLKNSSAGWDDIPAFVAKQCVDNFIDPITCIINKSVSEGVFPSELKLARVVPIHKAGDMAAVTNYRPISVLTFFSKIFEKIMYNKLINFLDINNAMYKYQFGFRQNTPLNRP